jgi:hypothetical protein
MRSPAADSQRSGGDAALGPRRRCDSPGDVFARERTLPAMQVSGREPAMLGRGGARGGDSRQPRGEDRVRAVEDTLARRERTWEGRMVVRIERKGWG